MGGVKESPNQYRFFGSAESLNTAACPGTRGVQGVYAFTADLSTSPPAFTSDCAALLQPSGPLVETGIAGSYDRNYIGGGPTMRVIHPDGRRGVLLVYHAEIQWYDDGPCASGPTLCFYGTLGMALSTDDGATFQKLGLIIQSHISRATFHTPPYLGGNVPIGNGPFVLGDAAGNAVDPRIADPAQTYIYVFYVDNQEDLGAQDPCAPAKACLAVARAPLAQVIQAAFAGDGATLSGLFQKYFNGGFTEPAAPPDPNGILPTNNAGRYTPVLKGAFSPSAIYDAATRQVILASVTAGQIQLRVSQNLLDWSQPPVATLSEAAPFAEVRYPSLIGELEDANVAGGQPWLFYSREPPNGAADRVHGRAAAGLRPSGERYRRREPDHVCRGANPARHGRADQPRARGQRRRLCRVAEPQRLDPVRDERRHRARQRHQSGVVPAPRDCGAPGNALLRGQAGRVPAPVDGQRPAWDLDIFRRGGDGRRLVRRHHPRRIDPRAGLGVLLVAVASVRDVHVISTASATLRLCMSLLKASPILFIQPYLSVRSVCASASACPQSMPPL